MDIVRQKQISELRPGDSVSSFFVVRKKDVRIRQHNHAFYLTFEFGDASGRIRGTIWENIKELNRVIGISDIVKVKGSIITYRDSSHIAIEEIRKALDNDHVNAADFLPRSKTDVETMYADLLNIVDFIKNSDVKRLVLEILSDENIVSKLKAAPAAKLMHHNFIGGLMDHTLSVARICLFLNQHYSKIDTDILLAGAILHDIGKIEELSTEGYIDYSTQGRLLGHITISAGIVGKRMCDIPDFPAEIGDHLLHCILSHHGSKEFGSPVVPATVEALLLHYADELDSKVDAFLRIINKETEPGKEWSSYVNILDRFIYMGNK